MKDLDIIKNNFVNALINISKTDDIKDVRANFLGKKSEINEIFKNLLSLSEDEKKNIGVEINDLKNFISNELKKVEENLLNKKVEDELKKEMIDITLPIRERNVGYIHPLSYIMKKIENIALSMGFSITSNSEIENDWYCFESLNIPQHHPARQMQDTFYLKDNDKNEKIVLRTQTTSIQVREMSSKKPPFKFINYGKTFRSEMDATHAPMFHQMDFVYLDKNINMQDLKNCLITFLKKFFNLNNVPLRFRPSYFPFTSPSIEVDIKYKKTDGKLILGEGDSWLEILGAGMIHPNVLKNAKIDSEEYQGFAFAFGVERMGMLKYGIKDIRNLYDGDIRFLKEYGFKIFE